MGEDMDGAMQQAPQPGRHCRMSERSSDGFTRPIILDRDDTEIAVGQLAFGHDPARVVAHGDIQPVALSPFHRGRLLLRSNGRRVSPTNLIEPDELPPIIGFLIGDLHDATVVDVEVPAIVDRQAQNVAGQETD